VLPAIAGIRELLEQAHQLHPLQETRDIGGIDDQGAGEVRGAHAGRLAGQKVEHVELRGRQRVRLEGALGLLLQGLGSREDLEDEMHEGERGAIS
jgi:hypothetical protein